MRYYQNRSYRLSNALDQLQEKYDQLVERCRPFLDALEHFPEVVHKFVDLVKGLFREKEAVEKAERERILAEKETQRAERRVKNKDCGWER